jgi:4a-hydroxytetrahydrobiopterin dehydratase
MLTLEYRRLSPPEIETAVGGLEHWSSDGTQIGRTFSFPTYLQGISFACGVGYLAEQLNHHPDLSIGYRKVTIRLSTHDVGGISPYDIELATRINALG